MLAHISCAALPERQGRHRRLDERGGVRRGECRHAPAPLLALVPQIDIETQPSDRMGSTWGQPWDNKW